MSKFNTDELVKITGALTENPVTVMVNGKMVCLATVLFWATKEISRLTRSKETNTKIIDQQINTMKRAVLGCQHNRGGVLGSPP